MQNNIKDWVRSCLQKKKLSEGCADIIIEKANKENKKLYKYYCKHCFGWHLTKQQTYNKESLKEFINNIKIKNHEKGNS